MGGTQPFCFSVFILQTEGRHSTSVNTFLIWHSIAQVLTHWRTTPTTGTKYWKLYDPITKLPRDPSTDLLHKDIGKPFDIVELEVLHSGRIYLLSDTY